MITREQAIKASNTLLGCCDADNGLCVDIINSIYDDMDSRICGNCNFANTPDGTMSDVWCININSDIYDVNVSKDFGCNLFKRKEKDNECNN